MSQQKIGSNELEFSAGVFPITGAISVSAGSNTAPAYTTTDDTNTGIFFPAADTIAFTEGGAERMRIDSSGTLIVGATASPTAGVVARPPLYLKQFNNSSAFSGMHIEASADDSILGIGYNGSTFQIGTSYRSTGAYKDITFNTNASERLRIDTNGNVGIGTSSPTFKLDVVSTGNDVLKLSGGASATFMQFNAATTDDYAFGTVTSLSGLGVKNLTDDRYDFFISDGGNVGVGTTSPNQKLEVSGRVLADSLSAASAVYIWSQNRMSLGASVGIESQQSSPLFMLTQGVAQPIVFGTNSTERMRIDSSGNVGIGTTSIANWTKLEVRGTAGAQDGANQQILVAAPTTTAGQGAGIRLNAASGAKEAVAVIGVVNEASGNNGALVFHNYNGGATVPERMRITSGGRLLVGTTSENTSGGVLQVSNGITFPATQSASNDANTLDDYEEGTWTPTFTSGSASFSYISQYGSYTKIGRLVLLQFYLYATASGTTSNEAVISNLPFASANLGPLHQSGGGIWFTGTNCQPLVGNNTATITLWKGGAIATNTAADVSNKYLVGMVMYQTA